MKGEKNLRSLELMHMNQDVINTSDESFLFFRILF
jgi:hypothetical protein